jgi:predicted DNA-binding transcriptional regulator AlpA
VWQEGEEMNDQKIAIANLVLSQLAPHERLVLAKKHGLMLSVESDAKPEECVLRRTHVAKRFGVSLRAIDLWTRQGLLRKVSLPGRERSVGFLSSEVEQVFKMLRAKSCGTAGVHSNDQNLSGGIAS